MTIRLPRPILVLLPALLPVLLLAVLPASRALCPSAFALDAPPLAGRVVDLADMISPRAEQDIAAVSAGLEGSDSTQVVVLTVPSLEGESLDDYSLRVAEAWGLGKKGRDNGVLILAAKAERQVRIEVGYGLEGRLTDLLAGRIIDQVITPRFKAGDFDGGFVAGAQAVAQAVRGEFKAEGSGQGRGGDFSPLGLLLVLAVMGFLGLLGRLARPTGRGVRGSGFWMGGGGLGGGGFGGGGFGGGGGGFGGGGASGGW